MSLIDEALRRARQEAALQDSAKRDAQYRQVPVYAPAEARRTGPMLIAAIVAACVIAGVGIGLFLGRPEQAAVEATAPPPIEAPKETPEPAPTPSPVREAAPERQQVPVAAAEPLQPPPVLDAPPPPAPVAEPIAPAPEPTPTPAPVQATPEPTPAEEIRTYVREVPLPDGGVLRLSGIAFSSAQPVALINDRVLAKGETYQGFLVSDIQANLVELRGNGMTVRVTLK